ncbi:MAG: alanine racemase [Acidobacteriota bacterium]|nr:alanine racemase [Acidobacteriota bacterium]
MSSWTEVSEERLAGNFRVIAEAAGAETDVLAVVKANAYGHGAEICAVALARAGAKWFAVANVSEGERVRRALEAAGLVGDTASRILLMCGFLPEDVAAIVEHDLTPVVWTPQQVEWLAGTGARVHVEVETGMGRQGVRAGADLDVLLDASGAVKLELDGVCTHFCAAEAADGGLTRVQQRRFADAIVQIKDRGLRPQWVHAGSTSSVDNPILAEPCLMEVARAIGARAMVRCGIGLYGYCLPIDGVASPNPTPKIRAALQPVMTWKTRIMDVREVAAGETVGYNASFTAPRPMRLALLAAGYADGLRRSLSSTNARPGGWVMIDGQRAPVVGRVSMNLTMVDVTGIGGVRVGDEVVLLGDGVTADDHARLAGTISYEILCGVRSE